ncbi:porin [Comamonas composti]|uniref:porin n=1 Tax=Comamonas composti TaxID=408558 RepID=UPI0004091645|nr:porin [Comamonas composti]
MAFPSWPRPVLLGATALCCALGAQAQSNLAFYGFLDLSVTSSDNGARGSGRVTGLSSGVGTGSRIGLRGQEDLGGGLKALFQLEMGLEADSGALKTFTGNYASATPSAPGGLPSTGGFNRRSHVGLQSDWGTVLLGRDYTPMYYTALATDTLKLAYLGNVQGLLSLAGGSERLARMSNGVFYTSPQLGGLRLRAAYGFGAESPGGAGNPPKDAHTLYGVGADFSTGGLVLSAAYQQIKLPTVGGAPLEFTGLRTRKDLIFGAQYRTGPWLLSAGHFRVNAPQKGEDTWLGAGYTFGVNTVKLQVQRLRQDNPSGKDRRATVVGAVFEHGLSKRTSLYTSYSRSSNNATGQFGVTGSDTSFAAGAAGAKVDVLALGVKHSF